MPVKLCSETFWDSIPQCHQLQFSLVPCHHPLPSLSLAVFPCSGTVVTGLWQRDTSVGCFDEAEDTISETGAFHNSYQISGLEPGNRYTIIVRVSNAAGTAPASNSVTGTTLETGERESLLLLSVNFSLHSSH